MDESGFLAEPYFARNPDQANEPMDRYNRLQMSSTPNSRGSISRSRLSLSSDIGDYPPSEGSTIGSSFLSDSSSRTRYEAESPDELALVKAASTYGCRLLRRSPDKVIVWLPGMRWLFHVGSVCFLRLDICSMHFIFCPVDWHNLLISVMMPV